MAFTKSPVAVFWGDPQTELHNPDRRDIVTLLHEIIGGAYQSEAELSADDLLSYSVSPGKMVVTAGQIIPAGGERYEVVASTAIDNTVTTAGGVKLKLLPRSVDVDFDATSINQTASGSYFAPDGARVNRLADRVMVGDAVAYDGSGGAGAGGSWVTTTGAGTVQMGWIERNAGIASVVSKGAIGLTGAARNVGVGGGVIGILGYAYNAGNIDQTSWGAYIESVRSGGSNGSAWAVEIDTTNLAPSPAGTLPLGPYGARGATFKGTTIGLGIQSGGDPNVNPNSYDCDVAIMVGSNGAKWLSGLVFRSAALYHNATTGRAHAISMAPNQAITWFGSAATGDVVFYQTSSVQTITDRQGMEVTPNGIAFKNNNNTNTFQIQRAVNSVNFPFVIGGTSGDGVRLGAAGEDDVTMQISPKGVGEVRIQSGDFTNKIRVNSTGLGFFNTAPVAKPTGVAVSSAGIHAALVSLGLISA